jgi:hypothetical protein
MMMLSLPILCAAAFLLTFQPQATPQMPDWKPFQFLLGTWEAQPDPASGGTVFEPALQGRILIRRNFSLTGGSRHDDLMIIRFDDEKKVFRADYIDNEGHLIHYRIVTSVEGQLTFLSTAGPEAPTYKLTYKAVTADVIDGSFDIAPPGKPNALKSYLSWTMKRSAAKP